MSSLNAKHFHDDNAARLYLEAIRWPRGPACPHCGAIGEHYALQGNAHRPGLWKCKDCRQQFSVTVGTVFELNHTRGEYARGNVTTNTVEGYFSIFKRGMKGVYQHCDEAHLHRYLAEFDFRYNNRIALEIDDTHAPSMRSLASAASDSPTEGLVIAPGESNVIGHRRLQMAGRIVEKFRVQADLGRSRIVVCTESQIDVITPTSTDHESIGGLLDYDFEDGGKANKIDDETYKDVLTGEVYHRPS